MKSSEEVWKPIDYYQNYEVSNLGRVKNKKNDKILKPWSNKKGYKIIDLYNECGGKHFQVHRLVLETFRGKSKLHVDHLREYIHRFPAHGAIWLVSG